MSNYNLTPPVQTKQINLFSAGSSNAVNISAPSSLSSDTIFPLPSTIGTNGQFLSYNALGSTWSSTTRTTSQFPISGIFYGNGTTASFTSAAPNFVTIASFYFPGTSSAGTPSECYIIMAGGTNVTIRFRDRTNNITVASVTIPTPSVTQSIINLPIIGSFSSAPSIIEIQGQSSANCTLHFFQILP